MRRKPPITHEKVPQLQFNLDNNSFRAVPDYVGDENRSQTALHWGPSALGRIPRILTGSDNIKDRLHFRYWHEADSRTSPADFRSSG